MSKLTWQKIPRETLPRSGSIEDAMTLDEARKKIKHGKRALSIWPSDEHGTPIGGQSNWRESRYWVVVDALRCRPLTRAMSRAEALTEELRLRKKG